MGLEEKSRGAITPKWLENASETKDLAIKLIQHKAGIKEFNLEKLVKFIVYFENSLNIPRIFDCNPNYISMAEAVGNALKILYKEVKKRDRRY